MRRREFMARCSGAARSWRASPGAHAMRADRRPSAGGAQSRSIAAAFTRRGASRRRVRRNRLRRARSGRRGAVPARLPAQWLPVAWRARAAVGTSPLHRARLPRPRLHARSPRARASRPTRRSRCSWRCSTHSAISDGRHRRERQRRCGRTALRDTPSRARADAAADELRRGDRQPAAGAAARSSSWRRPGTIRRRGSRPGSPTRRWPARPRASAACATPIRAPDRRGDRVLLRAARELAGAQGAGARLSPSRSNATCWQASSRRSRAARCRPASCGGRPTRSSRRRARTIWIAPSATRAACAARRGQSSSGRKSYPRSSRRRRVGCGALRS